MIQPKTESASYRFGDFFIDAQNRQRRRSDQVVLLNSKSFDVLLLRNCSECPTALRWGWMSNLGDQLDAIARMKLRN